MITQHLTPVSAAQARITSSVLTPESFPGHLLGMVMEKATYALFKSMWKQQSHDLRGPGTCHGTDVIYLRNEALAGPLFAASTS